MVTVHCRECAELIEFTYDANGNDVLRPGRRCRILGQVGALDYGYDPQGNLIETKVYSGALVTVPVERGPSMSDQRDRRDQAAEKSMEPLEGVRMMTLSSSGRWVKCSRRP